MEFRRLSVGQYPRWTEPIMGRLPLQHPRRLSSRDEKLWNREQLRAKQLGKSRMKCPCTQCVGRHTRVLREVYAHLTVHGRHPQLRLWNDTAYGDSSDEEWMEEEGRCTVSRREQVFAQEPAEPTAPVNEDSQCLPPTTLGPEGFDLQRMVTDIFQDLDAFHVEMDNMEDNDAAVGDDAEDADGVFELGEGDNGQGMYESPLEIQDALQPLFRGSNFSKLAFVMMFLNICGNHNVPNIFVSEILAFLHKSVLPAGNVVPATMYAAKKLISSLGLNYISIHACPQGCVLFRGEHAELLRCPKCGEDRYKNQGTYKQPATVLRHFPLIPRLQRMFRSRSISEMMTWATDNRSTDGMQRHIGDSKHWNQFNEAHPDFAAEPRNVRLGLSLDGVNPFGDKNNKYSCWPVTLLNYNLPPWMLTKRFFVILALLIPGPQGALSKNVDVWLTPLVEELKILWLYGVPVTDVLSRLGRPLKFTLRGALIATVADYPAHSMIAGQSGKGYIGCTRCGPNVTSDYSAPLRSVKYLGHRRFLPPLHRYRHSRPHITHWNNVKEVRGPPPNITTKQFLEWGKLKTEYDVSGLPAGGPGDPGRLYGTKRQTRMDMELPYWRVRRHCFWPMVAQQKVYSASQTGTIFPKPCIVCVYCL